MYIIRPTVEIEARKALIEELNTILTSRGSEAIKVNDWGTREFAYEIDDLRKGYYVVLEGNMTVEGVNELDRICRIKEQIVRHIIINRDEL
jgi:small subunit ribosomal protein S6